MSSLMNIPDHPQGVDTGNPHPYPIVPAEGVKGGSGREEKGGEPPILSQNGIQD